MSKQLTPTEQRILDLLSDGKYHTQSEMIQYLDEYMSKNTLAQHLYYIREKLRPYGETISTDRGRGTETEARYMHCRLVSIAE